MISDHVEVYCIGNKTQAMSCSVNLDWGVFFQDCIKSYFESLITRGIIKIRFYLKTNKQTHTSLPLWNSYVINNFISKMKFFMRSIRKDSVIQETISDKIHIYILRERERESAFFLPILINRIFTGNYILCQISAHDNLKYLWNIHNGIYSFLWNLSILQLTRWRTSSSTSWITHILSRWFTHTIFWEMRDKLRSVKFLWIMKYFIG